MKASEILFRKLYIIRAAARLGTDEVREYFPNEPLQQAEDVLASFKSRKFCTRYAIWCAEKALAYWKMACLTNKAPEIAIKTAKAWLRNPTEETAEQARFWAKNAEAASREATDLVADDCQGSIWAATCASWTAECAGNQDVTPEFCADQAAVSYILAEKSNEKTGEGLLVDYLQEIYKY